MQSLQLINVSMLLQSRLKNSYKKLLFPEMLLPKSLLLLLIMVLNSCSPKQKNADENYFKIDSTQVQTGGVKMIPVTTKNGTYNVWTKRIGNNPKIKVLLLAEKFRFSA
ncbi:hypothetical protein [Chryseobacterium wanjuense]